MYRYGDPGKGYGYGVYGGLDGPEYCPPDDVFNSSFEGEEAFQSGFIVAEAVAQMPQEQDVAGSSFIPEDAGTVAFNEEAVPPPTPCEDV